MKETNKEENKFEFIKETEVKIGGEVTYFFTRMNNVIVTGSLSLNEKEAYTFFQKLCLTGLPKFEQVLETNIVKI